MVLHPHILRTRVWFIASTSWSLWLGWPGVMCLVCSRSCSRGRRNQKVVEKEKGQERGAWRVRKGDRKRKTITQLASAQTWPRGWVFPAWVLIGAKRTLVGPRKIDIQLLCSNCLSLPVSESRNSHFKSVYTWSQLISFVNFHAECASPGKVCFGQKFHISSDPGYDHDKQLPHPWLCCGVSL